LFFLPPGFPAMRQHLNLVSARQILNQLNLSGFAQLHSKLVLGWVEYTQKWESLSRKIGRKIGRKIWGNPSHLFGHKLANSLVKLNQDRRRKSILPNLRARKE
jgi:hypothetical protein